MGVSWAVVARSGPVWLPGSRVVHGVFMVDHGYGGRGAVDVGSIVVAIVVAIVVSIGGSRVVWVNAPLV